MVMRRFALAGIIVCLSATTVVANIAPDREPVLRLRLQDPLFVAGTSPKLRPRFSPTVTNWPVPVPVSAVQVRHADRIGTFAHVATAHPNLVVAVGAAEDRSEIGRQIDRALIGLNANSRLYQHQHDAVPFIGLGVRTVAASAQGWSADLTIGAGLVNAMEQTRLTNIPIAVQPSRFDAEARANLRLRYRF